MKSIRKLQISIFFTLKTSFEFHKNYFLNQINLHFLIEPLTFIISNPKLVNQILCLIIHRRGR